MIYRLTEQAAVTPPVSTAEVKTWLRVTHSDHDTMIADLLKSVSMQVENITGLSLSSRQFIYTAEANKIINAFSIQLPRRPVTDVASVVKYDLDQDNETLTVDDDYYLGESGTLLFNGFGLSRGELLKITFTAGETPPEPIKTIIKREVARQYTYSSDVVIGTAVIKLPKDALDALTQYRQFYC